MSQFGQEGSGRLLDRRIPHHGILVKCREKGANALGSVVSGLQDALARAKGGQGEIRCKFIRLGQCMETRMAVIVALADRVQRVPRRKEKEPVEAQILWFTGVRYERIAEAPKRRPAPRATRVKNKESA